MSPADILERALCRSFYETEWDSTSEFRRGICRRMAEDGLNALADQSLVVVPAERVIQQEGKVSVTRTLIESVLEDLEAHVHGEYVVNGKLHPAMRKRYLRDMDDIWKLREELRGSTR